MPAPGFTPHSSAFPTPGCQLRWLTIKFYKSFSEKSLTGYGAGRRSRIERHRLSLLEQLHQESRPVMFYEIGPGHGTLGRARRRRWLGLHRDRSQPAADGRVLKKKGLKVIPAWTPPMPMADAVAPTWSTPTRSSSTCAASTMRGSSRQKRYARLKPGGTLLRRRPRLSQGTAVLLGRRLHAQLRHDRAARQAAVQRWRIRDSSRRARHRPLRPG